MTVVPTVAPAFLTLSSLSDGDEARRQRLVTQLRWAQQANVRQEAFYEGSRVVRDLGIAIPPHLRDVEAVAAWPEIVVDVIDERQDWRGWYTPDADLGLEMVFAQNQLNVEAGQAVLDSLICGAGFMSLGTGSVDEPEVLVKAESPNRVTGTWDARTRRLADGLVELLDESGRLSGWKLYLPGETVTTERRDGRLVVVDRDQHGLPRIPLVMLANRPRTGRPYGRSEITRAVRSLTESGMRTLLGMEVAREFYAAPQRYLMGADESMFMDANGNPRSGWEAVIGRLLAVPRDEEGDLPVPGQFNAASPQPFTDILRTLSQMVSAASGVPASHLGFTTDNPASADAIRAADIRLDKRAIRRRGPYDMGLVELGEVAVLWRDGELPPPGSVRSLWGDPSTPTPAAAADRAVKLVGAGVLPPESDVTLEQLGFSDTDIQRIQGDRRRLAGRSAIAGLAQAAAAVRQDVPVVGDAGGPAVG